MQGVIGEVAAVSAGAVFAVSGIAVASEAVILPSGLQANLHETRLDDEGRVYRLRFVAPGFEGGEAALARIADDMAYLCRDVALPEVAAMAAPPERVVISLADKAAEFGEYDPAVTQSFEAFRVDGGRCIWEPF